MFSKKIPLLNPALLAALALGACGGKADSGPPGQGTPTVTVAPPVIQEVVDQDEFVGRFEAVRTVDLRPRATGYLQNVLFRDGQIVRKGQLLFLIDPRQAQAAVAQAAAQVTQAQATLVNAQTEFARSQALAAQRAASQEEVESRQATVRSDSAQVVAAQANLRARRLDLEFTRVYAPITGRISARKIDPGNSVTADQTVLTTIVAVDPLYFTFQGSEALLLKYQRQDAGLRPGAPVRVKLSDEADYSRTGTLDFVDNALDAGGGTIRARAMVPNPGGFLKPGMFGNLSLGASRPYPAMLVPDTAVMADAARQIVYVVGKEGTVIVRPVQTGALRGNLRVIVSGISRDDRVIISGTQRAHAGMKVTAKPGRIQPDAAPAAAAAPSDPPAASTLPAGGR